MFFSIENYNQIKSGSVLSNFFNSNKSKITKIKKDTINNNFINISFLFFSLYTFFNLKTNEINFFIKTNIESNRTN